MKKERGFTIIEVIVAVTIFAVVLLGSTAFFTFGSKVLVQAREQQYALQIAKELMTTKDTRDHGGCPIFTNPSYRPRVVTCYVPEVSQTYTATFSWEQVDHPYGASSVSDDYYRVIWTTVTWRSHGDNIARSLSLHSVGVQSPNVN
jgi:prepilin-type N-terminal cleavage/methylation domain-containing protein